jgi:hypothetical protein
MTKAIPETCQLTHASFRMLGEPVFRLSEGTNVPSMVVQLSNQEAVLPLKSVAREFRIDPDSPDGQMLVLIEEALDFVVALRIGDKLPSELNGGNASWDANEQDRKIAASRVRYNLVRCVFARLNKSVSITGGGAPGWEESGKNRELLKQAIDDAATLIKGTDAAEISNRTALICEEMAYIETMRRTLTRGMGPMREKLLRMPMGQVPISRQETFKQVQALATRGLKEIMNRFDDVDARLDDVLAMLRDTTGAVAWIRRQRDWLVRTNHSWSAMFTEWANAPGEFDDFLWKVVERAYTFLAPRFMSFQEWTIRDAKPKADGMKVQIW